MARTVSREGQEDSGEVTELTVVVCEVMEFKLGEEGVWDVELRGREVEGRTLLHLPDSPGRQWEQGWPERAQAHLRHLPEPLQRQQRRMGRLELEGTWET